MNKYKVKLLPKAYRDLEQIYRYISESLLENEIALNLIKTIENAIINLDEIPYRGAIRKVGTYANKGYRQLFIKNFTIIYRIDEINKNAIIVTVKYSLSKF
ncbi:MAG: type II toxin-antitoxin system RelE/ParE family toxin [Tissierellia bacterium]|nr:type II toxin-antitoxin system RelE/ParE family toxin [Tissierellia bacterium]